MTPKEIDEAGEALRYLRLIGEVQFKLSPYITGGLTLLLPTGGNNKNEVNSEYASVIYRAIYDKSVAKLEELNVDLSEGL